MRRKTADHTMVCKIIIICHNLVLYCQVFATKARLLVSKLTVHTNLWITGRPCQRNCRQIESTTFCWQTADMFIQNHENLLLNIYFSLSFVINIFYKLIFMDNVAYKSVNTSTCWIPSRIWKRQCCQVFKFVSQSNENETGKCSLFVGADK